MLDKKWTVTANYIERVIFCMGIDNVDGGVREFHLPIITRSECQFQGHLISLEECIKDVSKMGGWDWNFGS